MKLDLWFRYIHVTQSQTCISKFGHINSLQTGVQSNIARQNSSLGAISEVVEQFLANHTKFWEDFLEISKVQERHSLGIKRIRNFMVIFLLHFLGQLHGYTKRYS